MALEINAGNMHITNTATLKIVRLSGARGIATAAEVTLDWR
jgi:hypothetical protein